MWGRLEARALALPLDPRTASAMERQYPAHQTVQSLPKSPRKRKKSFEVAMRASIGLARLTGQPGQPYRKIHELGCLLLYRTCDAFPYHVINIHMMIYFLWPYA